MKILAVIDHYLPGYRSGGPIRSLSALVQGLKGEAEFHVLTSSTDFQESRPLDGVQIDQWNEVEGATVFYSSRPLRSFRVLRRAVVSTSPDVLYLNGLFSPSSVATVIGLRLRLLPPLPVILAPRGELSSGALGLRATKKKLFLRAMGALGVYKDITWHASSEMEADDIRQSFRGLPDVRVAPNLISTREQRGQHREKRAGVARFVYIARITPKKNLRKAIEFLSNVKGDVVFHVYGTLEDASYWESCLAASAQLPVNLQFQYISEVPHEQVNNVFSKYHFLLFPTLGENFGHTIAEALQQGCPVLISDQTPWRNLEDAGVGWDLSLDESASWSQALKACVEMDNGTYQLMSGRCRGFAEEWVAKQGGADANLRMFYSVAAMR